MNHRERYWSVSAIYHYRSGGGGVLGQVMKLKEIDGWLYRKFLAGASSIDLTIR